VTHPPTNSTGANCEPNNATDSRFQESFSELTHVVYNVGIGAGIEVPATKTLTSTNIPVATQCLVKKGAEKLSDATEVLNQITEKSGSTGKSGAPSGNSGASLTRSGGWLGVCAGVFVAVLAVL